MHCHKLEANNDSNFLEGGWLLDKVIIHDILNDKSWLFNCYKWLSDVEDGTMTETELIAMENPKEGDWKVIVTTKDEEDSGTTSNVTMVVYGENDKSDDIPLGENGDVYFNPGSTDTFDIILKDKVTGGEVTFTCERWLSREHDDEEIVRELPAVFAGVEEEEEIEPPP
ncbi:lipoxygenase homology domain-containing protein 1-like, partial [Saccoglossus kowalevskii]